MRISKAFTGAEVQDLNVFGSESGSVDVVKTKMPMEEKVEVGDRVRRRAVFAKVMKRCLEVMRVMKKR